MAYDHEYQRNGVSNLFMLFATRDGPGGGHGPAHQDRLGEVVRKLVDEDYPNRSE